MCTLEINVFPAEGAIAREKGMLFDLVAVGRSRPQPLIWIAVQEGNEECTGLIREELG